MTTARQLASKASEGRKNFIPNGVAPYVNQEGNKVGITNGEYFADLFKFRSGGTVTGVANGTILAVGGKQIPGLNITTGDATIEADAYYFVDLLVEGYDTAPLNLGKADAKTVTLSFTHRHTQTGTYCVALKNSALDRVYVFEYTQSVSNAIETHSETISLDVTGTWLTDDGIGLQMTFVAAAGANFQGAAGSWSSTANLYATANQANAYANAGNTFLIGDVQLEIGEVATDPEYIPYSEKLAQVQRYFLRYPSDPNSSARTVLGAGYNQGSTNGRCFVKFPSVMRTIPSFATTNSSNSFTVSSNIALSENSVTVVLMSSESAFLETTAGSGLTAYAGNVISVRPDIVSGSFISFDARL